MARDSCSIVLALPCTGNFTHWQEMLGIVTSLRLTELSAQACCSGSGVLLNMKSYMRRERGILQVLASLIRNDHLCWA